MKNKHIVRLSLLKICYCLTVVTGLSIHCFATRPIMLKNNLGHISLGYQINYLEDRQHSYTAWDILHKAGHQFSKNKKPLIHFSYTPSTYWFKVQLKNISKEEKFILEVDNAQLDSITVYQFLNRKLISETDKDILLGENNREFGLFRSTFMKPFDLKPADSIVFIIKMRSISALKSQVAVYSDYAFDEAQQKKLFIYTFFTGVLCLVFLFSLFLYFVIKDKVYLYYGGYALFFWFTVIGISGYYASLPIIAQYDLRQLFTFGLLFFALKFTETFLLVKNYKPILSRAIKFAIYYILFCFALYVLLYIGTFSLHEHRRLHTLVALLYNLMLLVSCSLVVSAILFSIKNKYLTGWFYLTGLSPVILTTIVGVLGNAQLIPFYQTIDYYYVFAVLFEIIVLYLGLVYRFKTYKDQKEKLLIEYNNSQRELVNSLVIGQEMERKRLSEELHDGLGQWLAVTKLHVAHIAAANKREIQSVEEYIDRSIKELRDISRAMMPGSLVHGGLIPALEEMVNIINPPGKIKVELYYDAALKNRIKRESEVAIFRIIQEALTNILKHANAQQISLQLLLDEEGLRLMVEDDGAGFIYNDALQGNGLKNMQSRVQLLNGKMAFDSSAEKGTLIFVEIPIAAIN